MRRGRALLVTLLLAVGVPAIAQAEPPGSTQLKLPAPADGQVSAALIQTTGAPKTKAIKPAGDVLSLVQSGKPRGGKVQSLVVAANLRTTTVKPKPPALSLGRSLLAPSKELANALAKAVVAKKLCPAAVLAGKPKLTSTAGLPKDTGAILAGMLVRVLCGTGSSFDQFILILVGLDVPGFVFPSDPTTPDPDGSGMDPAPGDPGGPGDPSDPPDPPVPPFAPPLPPGAPTSLYDATSFLYTGANAVQTGVAQGAIDAEKVAVLRGGVHDDDFKPIPGVKVSILDHGEYGSTLTNEKGGFDMAVNGGGPVTIVFERDGYTSIQRTVEPPWRDYLVVEPVALTPWDPRVTTIEPDSAAAFQVARGTESVDMDGERQATLLFPEGADATMEMPDGSTQPLGAMNVRATEYTVGGTGEAAMPGELPDNSGYTYAVEFSVDQAEAAGATDVRFDEPVINYTENFVGAPVGSPVPTGYYDSEQATWVPSKNGIVVKIISETGGLADLDITGDGVADSVAALAAEGIIEPERGRLANLYDPPQELWRVEITHFTPWDHNWPFGLPPGARAPQLPEFQWKPPDDPCPRSILSTVGCESQTVNETIPITGTPFELVYQNDRTLGWTADDFVEVPVTPNNLPPGLAMVKLTMDIQGQRTGSTWCNPQLAVPAGSIWDSARAECAAQPAIEPNITVPVEWDGLDAYGRPVQGRPQAKIELEFLYPAQWYGANSQRQQSFASAAANTNQSFTFRRECRYAPIASKFTLSAGSSRSRPPSLRPASIPPSCLIGMATATTRTLGHWDALPAAGLGGWSLDVHHGYDPNDDALNLGNGQTVRSELNGQIVTQVAGGNGPANGGPPLGTNIDYLVDIDRGPDGSIYVLRDYCFGAAGRILKISPDGERMDVFADNRRCSDPGVTAEPSGDGGPATEASFGGQDPTGLGVGPDGSVYVSARGANQVTGYIKKIDPEGIVSTVAGIPWTTANDTNTPDNEGGLAAGTQVHRPDDIEVAADGTIYFAEENNVTGRAYIRKIDPSGVITTIAGGPNGVDSNLNQDLGTGEPALEHELEEVQAIEIGPDGGVYIADIGDRVVQRIGIDGIITRVAGNGTSDATVYGQPALENPVHAPEGLAFLPDGDLLVRATTGGPTTSSDEVIFRINDSGLVRSAVGAYEVSPCDHAETSGNFASRVCLQGHAKGLVTEPDGDILFTDSRHYLNRAQNLYPELAGGGVIPNPDGTELFGFDPAGRHLTTKDPLTGQTMRTFDYDAEGRLSSISDAYGNVTTVERDTQGRPLAIVAPGGQRTSLTVGNDGYLASIANPASEAVSVDYTDGGLLTRFERPSGAASTFSYDGSGRVVEAVNAGGRVITFERTETNSSSMVTVETNGGLETVHETEIESDGDRRRSVTYPGGAEEVSLTDAAGVTKLTATDGTLTTVTPAGDPRFGMAVPGVGTQTLRLPSGQTRTTTVSRAATYSNPSDLQTYTGQTVTTTVNGRSTLLTYSRPNRTITVRSPLNRTSVTTLDATGRVLSEDADGPGPLLAITYSYDDEGRLIRESQGAQSLTYVYDMLNRPISRTDAGGAVTTYAYDAADRLTEMKLPNGQTYRYGYDVDGNRTSITTPNGGVNGFSFSPDGFPTEFRPPGLIPGHRWTFDGERDLVGTQAPSGDTETYSYDPANRLTGLTSSSGTTSIGFSDQTTRAAQTTRSLTGGASSTTAFSYDGELITNITQSGASSSDLDLSFDNDLRLNGTTMTSGSDVVSKPLTRDNDGFVTGVGPFTFTHDGPAGLVGSVSAAGMSSARTYDGYGRVASRAHTVNGTQIYGSNFSYDSAGNMVGRTETVAGEADRTFAYTYDATGRLTEVRENGVLTANYAYDANGNRRLAGAEQATFDAQDRLISRGSVAYGYDADGYLASRGAQQLEYSSRGELVRAQVGSTVVTYGYDALGRRVSRTEGSQTRRYIYGEPGNPFLLTAVRDEAGQLTSLWYDDSDLLIAFDRVGERFHVATDQVGTPRVVATSNGTVVKRVRYDAFGVPTADSAPAFDLPIGYAGGIPDQVTGLVRFGLRDYDPASASWTARDPALFSASPLNLYAYVGGDPILFRDQSGLVPGMGVGGAFYIGIGLEAQFQFGKDGPDNPWQFALCGGFGLGGGAEVNIEMKNNLDKTGAKAFVEASAKAGPGGQIGVGAELSLDCFEVTGKGTAAVGPVGGEIETDFRSISPGSVKFARELKAGGSVKGGIKGCIAW